MTGVLGLASAQQGESGSAASQLPSFLFILGDDIGWSDFRYNNGTVNSPNIDAWAKADGSVLMQDFHSGGTVCAPTRATVLTGRNHFRDCVDAVFDCSDMTECVPNFEFAPKRTFTIADAARKADKGYKSWFGGKWHLGSLYNDSEKYGGITSSPLTHGFDFMHTTVEVAPTATTNCHCRDDWSENCENGHYQVLPHCHPGCCFNYWWQDDQSPHGVTNLTDPVGVDDSAYLADSFISFLEARAGRPFLAQISFHNCHIPYIGSPAERAKCSSNETCRPPDEGAQPYTEDELDFYACLNEFDGSIGRVLDALKRLGYYDNTLVWWSGSDNGPEENCFPDGYCKGTVHRPKQGPGSAGVLRGRKRDVWEGGHRVPGLISWPAVVKGPARTTWGTVVSTDFLATVMDVLDVERPAEQANWAFDGKSVMPILRGEQWPARGVGWMFNQPVATAANGYAFRYGKWKLSVGGISCNQTDCKQPQLYDLEADIGEHNDLSSKHPDILAAITANFSTWFDSIHNSMANESKCRTQEYSVERTPLPTEFARSAECTFVERTTLPGPSLASGHVASMEACCGACLAHKGCAASEFRKATAMHPSWDGRSTGGTCDLKAAVKINENQGSRTFVCINENRGAADEVA